jgi:hypothetical protein
MTFIATTGNEKKSFGIEQLYEVLALIKALSPKSAPGDLFCINGLSGLNIIKNEMLPTNTIMVSKDLFNLIYESATTNDV